MVALEFDRRHGIAFAVAVAVLAGAGVGLWALAGPETPDARDGRVSGTPIDSCTTITEPGRYVLESDVTADETVDTCLRVRSSDVVVEGAGNDIEGVGAFGTAGVAVESPGGGRLSNVTVLNVTVRGWDDGVRLVRVDGGRLAGVTATDDRVGVLVLNTRNVALVDVVARDNRLRGVSLLEDSADNRLVNTTATGNQFGIHLAEPGARNNTLIDGAAADNEFGVVLVAAHGNTLRGTEATGNRIAGVWLAGARNNTIADSVVSNRFYGVFLTDRANGNRLVNTTARGNAVGVRLRSSDGNRAARTTATDSSDAAVLLISSDDNAVVGTRGAGNARGVAVVRSSGNRLENNSVGA